MIDGQNTSPKNTEQALAESEERFRRLFESDLIGIHFWDADGTVTEANEAYLRMVGYSRHDLSNKQVRWREMTPSQYAVLDDAAIRQMKAGGACASFEKEYIRKDGSRMPILLSAALLPHSKHQGVAFAIDLTERKSAEHALRQSEEMFRSLAENSNVGFWRITPDGFTRYLNPSGCRMLEIDSPRELEGRTYHEFFTPESREIVRREHIKRPLGEPSTYEVEIQGKRGGRRKVLISGSPVMNDDGTLDSMIGTLTDVTELQQAQAQLHHEQRLLHILMQHLPDAVYFKDLESRFVRVNPAQACFLGVPSPNEAIGHSDSEYFDPDSASAYRADELRVIETGQAVVGRVEHNGRAGDALRWFSTTKVPIRDEAGSVVGTAGVSRDITNLIKAEGEIRTLNNELEQRVAERTAMLEAANRRLEAEIAERIQAEREIRVYQERLRSLASELSLAEERERRKIAIELHDHVGQTLALIQIKLEAARNGVTDRTLAADLGECVDLIRQPIKDTRSLVFDLSPPVLYDLGFEAAAAWLVDQHQGRAGIAFSIHDDELEKPLDQAVAVLLFRAIRELLTNVIKHSQACTAQVELRRIGRTLQATVSDDGRGFAPVLLCAYATPGGFGLFSVREQLERVGGTFEVRSEPGSGSQVTLTVPLQRSPATHALGVNNGHDNSAG